MEHTFIQIGVGIFGLWLYLIMTLWSKKELGKLWTKDYWKQIMNPVLGIIVIIITLALLLKIVPGSGDLIEGAVGLSVNTELASFMSLGWFLGSSGNKIVTREKKVSL